MLIFIAIGRAPLIQNETFAESGHLNLQRFVHAEQCRVWVLRLFGWRHARPHFYFEMVTLATVGCGTWKFNPVQLELS